MTRRVRWTRAAEQDALDLYIHIGQDNPAAAEQVLRRIDQALATILTQPGIGTRRRRYGENVRSFPVFSYILFYREIDDGIELWRVIHGKRNIPRLLQNYSGEEE